VSREGQSEINTNDSLCGHLIFGKGIEGHSLNLSKKKTERPAIPFIEDLHHNKVCAHLCVCTDNRMPPLASNKSSFTELENYGRVSLSSFSTRKKAAWPDHVAQIVARHCMLSCKASIQFHSSPLLPPHPLPALAFHAPSCIFLLYHACETTKVSASLSVSHIPPCPLICLGLTHALSSHPNGRGAHPYYLSIY
jgi:hypothetical protein